MKNIFIGGVAKSGKSTIANKFNKDNIYNHIPLDYFASSLKHNFPSTKITSNVIIDDVSSKNLSLLLSRVIEIMNNNEKEFFIIDSAHILPFDIIKYLDRNKWDIYFVGYPNITKEEKLKLIRKYDTQYDWTFKKSDEELLNILDKLINLSKQIESECQTLNIKFIDTSKSIDYNIN